MIFNENKNWREETELLILKPSKLARAKVSLKLEFDTKDQVSFTFNSLQILTCHFNKLHCSDPRDTIMKRGSDGGSSPLHKLRFMSDSEPSSQELAFNALSQHSMSTQSDDFGGIVESSPPANFSSDLPSSATSLPCMDSPVPSSIFTQSSGYFHDNSDTFDDSFGSEKGTDSPDNCWQDNFLSEVASTEVEEEHQKSLRDLIDAFGPAKAALAVLENEDVRDEITKLIFSRSHASMKESLKHTKLAANKRDRQYLLTLTPKSLCEEFRDLCNPAFELLVRGLLGLSDPEDIFTSPHLLNTVSLLYSTVAKTINRQASGYALLLGTAARDGGLREDTLRIFSSCLVHPRTSQKYDKTVLSVGWNTQLMESLKAERSHFDEQREVEAKIEELLQQSATTEAVEVARDDLEVLLDTTPPQVQLVWDNLNLRSDHRFHRVGDAYSDSNLDWMASMWIKDRISANHMEHSGVALKDPENLNIKDFVTSEKERDYIFIALVHFFSSRLVVRHPILYKSIAKYIKEARSHQFQEAMDKKSEEFTGQLFTLSESSTEDLIKMMADVQINVHTYKDSNGREHCYEKKIVSGDNKTEKNMHYGILRLTMQ